jgi:hypothetical protein
VAARQMVPDVLAQVHYATRRNRRIDERRRLKTETDQRRAKALYAEDHRKPLRYCGDGEHVFDVRYLRGPSPDGMDCQSPVRRVCLNCDYFAIWSCGNRRESKCRPCSARYRRRVRAMAASGMSRVGGRYYFLTLTAPSDVHHYGKSGDECPCSVRGFDVGKWNASHSDRWNRFRTALAREFPELEYFRGIEDQKRGALHDHVLVWCQTEIDLGWLRKLAIRCGFGHEVDCPEIRPGSTEAAYYLSKYITKACDARDSVPWWDIPRPRDLEEAGYPPELVDALTGELFAGSVRARYRTWSKSDEWGTTMAALRAEAAVWAQMYADRESDPLVALLVAELGAQPVLEPSPD